MGVSGFQKFRLLLWKNYVLQKRHPIQTLLEIFLPLVFIAVLVGVRTIIDSKDVDASEFPAWSPTDTNASVIMKRSIDILTNGTTKPYEIWYTPAGGEYDDLMQRVERNFLSEFNHTYNETWSISGFPIKIVSFPSIDDIINNYTNNDKDVLAAVVFNKLEKGNIEYTLRFQPKLKDDIPGKKSFEGQLRWSTQFLYPVFQLPGPRDREDSYGGLPGYQSQGFTYLQYALDASLMEKYGSASVSGNMINDYELLLQRYPYPKFIDDPFLVSMQGSFPLLLMLSYIYTMINITKSVVVEKEKRLKESMKMMGLPNFMHWSAWFLKSFVFMFVTAGFLTALLKIPWYGNGLAVLTYCDTSILFIFFLCYNFATISLAFLVSTLFSKANLASIAAGVVFFLFYFPYFYMQPRYDSITTSTKVATSFMQNTAMALGCQIICLFEGNGVGSRWSNLNIGTNPQDGFTLMHVLLLMIFDGVWAFLLAIYIEGVRPGEFGVPLPWYFPFSKTYWFGSSSNSNNAVIPAPAQTDVFQEAPPRNAKAGIRIMGLSKMFGKKCAVNNLTLDMYEDQITSLLGHNGAGKTTTMSMLTGLFPPTSGTAIINNLDIQTNIKDVRDSLGLCPQHDVLFDEMTVEEHLAFFCQLKGHPDIQSEIDRMITAVGLEPKRHVQSHKLSGGMKRKLSVGIALVGGSKVVLLDEPTSGMDPGARRATWDLLVSEKKGRTMLLSTHFMDEADLLGDRIAIMAQGELQTVGSSLFLKKKFGGGYHLVIVKQYDCDVNKITGVLQKHLGDVTVEQDVGAELSYSLPDEKAHLFGNLFEELEQRRDELKVDSYGASITTMEEVFMRVGHAAEEKKAKATTYGAVNVTVDQLQKDSGRYALYGQKQEKNTGSTLLFQQLRAMIVKKALYSVRNWVLLTVMTLLPILFLLLALIIVKTVPSVDDSPPLTISLNGYDGTDTFLQCENDAFCDSYTKLAEDRKTTLVSSKNVTADILAASDNLFDVIYHKIISMEAVGKRLTAFFNNQPLHGQPTTLNYMTTALYRQLTNQQDASITVINHPLPFSNIEKAENAGGFASAGFQVGFNTAFGMSFLAAGFVVFLIKERESKSKHLQYVSGVRVWVFWLSNFLFDIINYIIPCIFLLILIISFQVESLEKAEVVAYVFIVFLLYGWGVIPLMYVFSFWFDIPSSGFVKMVMINLITGMAPILAVVIMNIPELNVLDTAKLLDWIFMIFPQYDLGYAIITLSTNAVYHDICPNLFLALQVIGTSSEVFCSEETNKDNPCCKEYKIGYLDWAYPGIGRYLAFLFLIGIVSWTILFIKETKIYKKVGSKPKQQQQILANADDTPQDSDVAAEAARIQNTDLKQLYQTDNLIIRNLRKRYGNFLAVKGLNLGVKQKECFGLLGVNGAGKTTTFKMLTGDLVPTSGDAFIYTHSVTSDIKEVQKNLGYCPQFDALIEELTGRETIRLFARLRGIPEQEIDMLADKLAANLLFAEHLDKRCGSYSGGNKRKLSTAIALIGNPPIVFLDEPTTGMDPVARRHLWNCISKVRDEGASIVLTSHSMEECEALCTRLVIMVNGEFKCLGSIQRLKNKFGEGYTVIAQLARKAPVTKSSIQMSKIGEQQKQAWETELETLQQFITSSFPGAILKDVHPGYVHYHVTNKDITWGFLFRQMEEAKKRFNLEAYSVGQTSLEQVFLNFAKNQIVDE